MMLDPDLQRMAEILQEQRRVHATITEIDPTFPALPSMAQEIADMEQRVRAFHLLTVRDKGAIQALHDIYALMQWLHPDRPELPAIAEAIAAIEQVRTALHTNDDTKGPTS